MDIARPSNFSCDSNYLESKDTTNINKEKITASLNNALVHFLKKLNTIGRLTLTPLNQEQVSDLHNSVYGNNCEVFFRYFLSYFFFFFMEGFFGVFFSEAIVSPCLSQLAAHVLWSVAIAGVINGAIRYLFLMHFFFIIYYFLILFF